MIGRLLTLAQAADELGCSPKTVRRRIDAGTLAGFRDGGLVRVPERALREYVARRVSVKETAPAACAASQRPGAPSAVRGRSLFDLPDPFAS